MVQRQDYNEGNEYGIGAGTESINPHTSCQEIFMKPMEKINHFSSYLVV